MAFAKRSVSAKTLSGYALAGGVTMLEDGSTLTVGAEAGTAATTFKGKISGGDTTLVKEGADYALTLSGPAAAVTNVVVKEGTLELRRQTARAGLVAYYAFDDAAIGADSSPAGFNLSKTGSGTVSQISGGISGKTLNFGGSAYIGSGVGTTANTAFPKGSESYTVSVWIRPTAAACSGTVPICCWGDNNTSLLSMIRFGSATEIIFTNWGSDKDASASGIAIADGNWHHVVATYDGATGKKRIYFDGVKKGENTATLNVGANNEFQIGHCSVPSRADQYYTGDMDEFMVFNHAWSDDDVANEYARKAPALVAAETLLPTPVAHWTFDDDAAPGADSSANALNLTMSGEVTLEDGDFICGKAARFSSTSGYFKLDTFPADVIPSGDEAFTVVGRYRADTSQSSGYNPVVVRWGDPNKWNSGGLFILGTGMKTDDSLRVTMCDIHTDNSRFYRTELGTDRSRWMTVAAVIGPKSSNKRRIRCYVDGELVSDVNRDSNDSLVAQGFSIGSSYTGDRDFCGLVDDVQIYGSALSASQIRIISEKLEASKGGATDSTASVLAATPDVTVAAGATLKVSSVETISSLSGAGDVEIAPLGRLSVAKLLDFSGTVSGIGALGIADNATLEFGDGASPVLVSDGAIALGANVTVNTAFRGGGTFTLATAATFTGVENLSTWKCSKNGVLESAKFTVSPDGKILTMSRGAGTIIIIR